jgi:phage terminase large subunit GpA-like protein
MIGPAAEFIAGLIDGLKPEPRLTVAEWAQNNRILSAEESAFPGPWRNEHCPYMYQIMEDLSLSSGIVEVVLMKSSQVSGTEAALNLVGYVIDAAPCRVMMVQPTDDVAKEMSKMRIAPMISSTPTIEKKIKPSRSRDSGNTIKLKQFSGGAFRLCGANTPVALRNFSCRVLILDEIDAYPIDLGGEGNPLELAEARNRTYGRRKKTFKLSTPTVDGKSLIQTEFLSTDQRYYYVPCPHCDHYQRLVFKQLKFTEERPDLVYYECISCHGHIEERHKKTMIFSNRGQWRSTVPGNESKTRRGYHISSLYAPSSSFPWSTIVEKWYAAQGNNEKLQAFYNTVLGEAYVLRGVGPPWEAVYNKRQSYALNSVTKDIYFITAGVDVQADRLEIEIVGWGKGRRSRSIDYRRFFGDTSQPEVWQQLSELMYERWTRPDGILLPIIRAGVDSGYNTHTVYDFCRQSGGWAIPVKGQESQMTILTMPRLVDISFDGKKVGTTQLWNIGVDILKQEFYAQLNLQIKDDGIEPPGYCSFPMYGEDYFKGLTSETKVYKVDRNRRKRWRWIKTFERNEPLDCRMYARAAAAVVGIDRFTDDEWDGILNTYSEETIEERPAEKKKRSSIWD